MECGKLPVLSNISPNYKGSQSGLVCAAQTMAAVWGQAAWVSIGGTASRITVCCQGYDISGLHQHGKHENLPDRVEFMLRPSHDVLFSKGKQLISIDKSK